MKVYGNLINRFNEGKNYTGRDIQIGDDITMYLWSDRECYYVTEVLDQKHIKVKKYHICADHDKAGGMGHQNWLYFKTAEEINNYLNSRFPGDSHNAVDIEEEWVYRYNKWQHVMTYNKSYNIDRYFMPHLNEKQSEKYEKGEDVKVYLSLMGKISFGVRDYYYDWEF